MTDLTFQVPDIHCDHCKSSLETAVGDLAGVSRAIVDIGARTVDTTFDETVTSADDIVDAIEGQGYEVTTAS